VACDVSSSSGWALRGGAGNEGDGDDNNNTNNNVSMSQPSEQLTKKEVRAPRLARMEAMMAQQAAQAAAEEQGQPQAMDVDSPTPKSASASTTSSASAAVKPIDILVSSSSPLLKKAAPAPKKSSPQRGPQQQSKKKAKESHASPADAARKLQRKQELPLKKILNVSLNAARYPACIAIDLDDATNNNLGVHSIAELLATRLSFPTTSRQLAIMPPQTPLIPYLAQTHRKASDELKTLRQTSNKKQL
jgi:hypothetical protein